MKISNKLRIAALVLPLLVMMASASVAAAADQWSADAGTAVGSEAPEGTAKNGTDDMNIKATMPAVIHLDTSTDATAKAPVILTAPDQGNKQSTNLRRTFIFGFAILVLLALCLVLVFSFTY
ncbi:MAG: hypothetical protein ACYCYM_00185 [Saccharofermentanales bacterium]